MNGAQSIFDDRTFVLTGMPRSGTTYLAAVLFNPPQVITLSEAGGAWRRFFREHGRSERAFELLASFRTSIENGEPMMTFAGTPGFAGRGRVDTWNQKKVSQRLDAAPGFHLGLKNPEVFLELLDIFVKAGVKCVVSVRHPVRVVNSWVKRMRSNLDRATSPDGQFADGSCVSYRSAEQDPIARRIDLFNYFARLIDAQQHHANVLVIRHEDWSVAQLARVCGFLDVAGLDHLRPPVIPPDPVGLPADEIERICVECAAAASFGYPLRGGRLAPPEPASAAVGA